MTRGVATHNEIKDLRPISEQLEIMQMHTEIYAKIDEIAGELRSELYQKTPDWSKTRTPSELFNFEQELQQTLNKLQTKIVGAILEAIHRDTNFVTECQKQALTQRKAQRFGYQNVIVRTLSGDRVRIRTPCSRRREKVEQNQSRVNKYGKET